MKTTRIPSSILLLAVVMLAATACSSQPTIDPTNPTTSTPTPTLPESTATRTPKPMRTSTPSSTPTQTMEPTQHSLYSTVSAIQDMKWATEEQHQTDLYAQFDQFSLECEDKDTDLSKEEISPDGNWIAASCYNKVKGFLIVQSKDGKKWVLDKLDFLSPETDADGMSGLFTMFWSSDGSYLYFSLWLGYSGGGDVCFPIAGDYDEYGLWRLNVNTGAWVTLIPATDLFPGYEIMFSPTGRHYAAIIDGLEIRDLQTGETTLITSNHDIERIRWSPDGYHLAYSVAHCENQELVYSTTYIWDASTNKTKLVLEVDDQILRPEFWGDNSTLWIYGDDVQDDSWNYTIYKVDIEQENMIITGLATPYP